TPVHKPAGAAASVQREMMTRYVLTRLLHTIPVLIVTTLLVFVILSFSPSDPAQLVLGLGATQEQLEAMREQLGLNEPLPVRYVKYMAGVLTGDFGVSYTTNRPVAELIGTRLPNTLILAFGSLLLVLLVALPLGIALAVRQNSVFDNVMRVVTLVTAAMPSFWLGLLLILLFSVQLRWLPSSGLDSIKAAILPLVCLSVAGWTVTSRLARASMLDVISQDYIRTARAKGLKERVVLGKHAFRNALLPVVTSVGLMIGQSVGGAVVIEILFGINGVGKLMVDAVRQQDVPTIMGGVLISAVVIAVANLLTDLSYAAIDPRLKTMYDGPA